MFSHGWLSASKADTRLVGSKCNIGIRNSVNARASSGLILYFSVKMFQRGQNSLSCTLKRFPCASKNCDDLLPLNKYSVGNLPNISNICARWSSSLSCTSDDLGSNRKSPVSSSKSMHASDHMSAVSFYSTPMITSGERYCLVCISSVKWWWWKQALPRSAITTSTSSSRKLISRCCNGFSMVLITSLSYVWFSASPGLFCLS